MAWLQVIAQSEQNPFTRSDEALSISVVSGSDENYSALNEKISLLLAAKNTSWALDVHLLVEESLQYYEGAINAEETRKLSAALLQRYAPSAETVLWWVHNHHLGKNLQFTAALMEIAQLGFPRLLLQIHDFPECGRPANWQALEQAGREMQEQRGEALRYYPQAQHIHYACINLRDCEILAKAGFDTERLSLLCNPIDLRVLNPEPEPSKADNGQGSAALVRMPPSLQGEWETDIKSLRGIQRYKEGGPVALYPVRSIRRKNILEAALINLLAGEPANLIVTLPGSSKTELDYSKLVERAYQKGLIQGLWGVGRELGGPQLKNWSFQRLCSLAQFFVSPSAMEGFGFTYFNPSYWGIPLFARHLDILEGFEDCFSQRSAYFYQQLAIPLKLLPQGDQLRSLYHNYFDRQLGETGAVELKEALDLLLRGPYIDFVLLPIAMQWQLLVAAREEPAFCQQLAAANRELLEKYQQVLAMNQDSPASQQDIQETRSRMEGRFSNQELEASLAKLYTSYSLGQVEGEGCSDEERQARVYHSFQKLKYHLAMFWDFSWREQGLGD